MEENEFEWDEKKRQANIAKHGVDFQDVPSAFNHPYTEGFDDWHSSANETRWKIFGIVKGSVVFFVYSERCGKKRIIMARPATKMETMLYYQQNWFDLWT